jgi:prepilin-type N-terminal cleavage/methylation domain-containing protein
MNEKGFTLMNSKGFTLIELLVVIVLLGIFSAALLVGLNPVERINSANDSKVQSDIRVIGTAFETNATLNNGTFAADQAALVDSRDLKSVRIPPDGYTYVIGTGGSSQFVWTTLKSIKYTSPGTTKWIWCSSTGKVSAQLPSYTCP